MALKEFAEVLKALREKAGLTQTDLAKRLGVYQSSIARWELGHGEPGVSLVRPLAKVLGVDIETIVNLPVPRRPKKK